MAGSSRGSGKSTGRRTNSQRDARVRTATSPSLLDDDARQDIIGVVLSATGVALTIAVLAENSGLLGGLIAGMLRSGVGLGAYILPILLLLWGMSFFVHAFAISERRVGAGLAIVLLAFISMRSVAVPVATQWESDVVAANGGYVGGVIAWALRSLLGTTISYVILGAAMIIGLVITGLSISGLVDWLAESFQPREPEEAAVSGRDRAPRTMPLTDVAEEPAGKRAARSRVRAVEAEDPQAQRQTVPTPPVATPRKMEGFELPPASILKRQTESVSKHRATDREMEATAAMIEETLDTFDIPSTVKSWVPGPTVTMYELEVAKGIKVSRVTALADDLALSLAAPTVRILAPIPGKALVGIEVPNERRSTVTLGDILPDPAAHGGGPLMLGIGKDVAGDAVVADLAAMPHLLIAGSTGTGKSVCINALLMSFLMRATPSEVRLILIDPKRIELSLYNLVPHLYVPVVTEPKEAASALAWAVSEMEMRLKKLQKAGARNIGMYNNMVQQGTAPEGSEELAYIVIVIDELADLMMVAAREVEDSIVRLAQLARAAGIHLIVATQRPSTDIITGMIKTNITNRIAFAVASGIDSRVILDQAGAEKLVGLGDMLFSTPAWPKPKRIQGAYVAEDEIIATVEHLKKQAEPDYHEEILHLKVSQSGGGIAGSDEDDDPLLWEAADIVLIAGMGSTSLLQRRLKVGYARAGRIMDMLEAKGIVGPPDGAKPREVLVDVGELEALKAFERRDAEQGFEG